MQAGRDKHTHRKAYREIDVQPARETDRDTDRQRDRQRDGQANRETER